MEFVPELDDADETFWRSVVERAPVALSLLAPDGSQIMGNRAYARLLGYDEGELPALEVGRFTRNDDQAWTQSYLYRLVTGELDRYSTEKT